MHRSRLCAVLIDCKTSDVDEAARFWAEALGRPVDPDHPGTRGNYRMLETPPDEPIVQIQRVTHESRVHIDSEPEETRWDCLGRKRRLDWRGIADVWAGAPRPPARLRIIAADIFFHPL